MGLGGGLATNGNLSGGGGGGGTVTGVGAGNAGVTIGGTSTVPTVALNLANPNTFTAPQTLPVIDSGGQVFNVEAFGSVATEAAPAVLAAHAAAAAVGGGTVFFSGIYPTVTGVQGLTGDNVTWQGAGKFGGGLQFTGTPGAADLVGVSTTAPPKNFVMQDLLLDGQATTQATHNLFKPVGLLGLRVRRCWFYRAPFAGILMNNCVDFVIDECLFQDLGTAHSIAISVNLESNKGFIQNSRFHYVQIGATIVGGNTANTAFIEQVTLRNNQMDLGWYTLPSIASGAVTSWTGADPALVLNDSGAAFSGLNTTGKGFVRVMPVLAAAAASSGTTTYDATGVTDSAAPFTVASTLAGMIIRTTGGKFGVVSVCDSTSRCDVEEWLDDTTRAFVSPPASAEGYTLYAVNVFLISSFTATSITAAHSIFDRTGTAVTAPATSVHYEVEAVPGSYPIYSSGSCRDILIEGNKLRRSFGDMIELHNNSLRHTIINNVGLDGNDTGCFLLGAQHICTGNTFARCGQIGIGGGSADSIIANNHCYDNPFHGQVDASTTGLGDLTIGVSRIMVIGNHFERLISGAGFYGISHNSGDSNVLMGNTSRNHLTKDYNIHTPASVTNAQYIGNVGVMDAASTSWAAGVVVSSQQSGTTYTFALTDQGTIVEGTNAGATTFTVPPNSSVAFPVDAVIGVCQTGAGQITLAQGAGVTLINASSNATRVLNSTIFIRQRIANTWIVSGDNA